MFGDMAWADGQGDTGSAPSDWELELLRMRYAEGDANAASAEPMELSPDPFYLSDPRAATNATQVTGLTAGLTAPTTTTATASMGLQSTQPTLTTSASCPSFTSLYDFDGDDLLRDIPDGEPLDGEPLLGGNAFHAGAMGGMGQAMGGYDYVLQFQQQHQHGNLRQFPHQASLMANDHLAVLQQSRRPLHTSASFTSLSSMETEYRRRLVTKRKKAVVERWNKAQRHKSFDSTTSSVATAPSPAASMEFSTYTSTSTFESTPEQQFLEELPAPRRTMESEMVGFSIDDFPTTFTSDASWPMPPPLSLANGASFESFGDAPPPLQVPPAPFPAPPPSDMDQLLLSDHERANVSSLLDAIRDFDSPLPTHAEEKTVEPELKRSSPKLATRPRSASGHNQHRASRSPHLRGIARMDSGKRKETTTASSPAVTPTSAPPAREDASARALVEAASVRDRIQLILDKPSTLVTLSEDEKTYVAHAPQFASAKAAETAGSLWLLLHASKCTDAGCSIAGCDVMRRVVRHCRGCDAPLGKCRDPCNDAKAMLLHHATCKHANKTLEAEDAQAACALCVKMQDIDKAHSALKARPPLSPQLTPHGSPPLAPMPIPSFGVPALSALGGPVLIAPQPAFSSPLLKPAGGAGSKHVPIQPNPLPTASNPMGMIGTFPHFGVSLALYLEQTSAPFRAEVKARVEKRVTNAAGQDLIQHMQKKTRLRSLEDLRAEARAIVLGEMERELHLHMQAVNWASIATSSNGDSTSSGNPSSAATPAGKGDSSIPPYLLSVAAAGFAAFYAQQASLQAAIAGVASPFGLAASSRQSLSRQSSTGSLTTSASSSSLASLPLAPKRSMSSSSLTHHSPSMSPKETLPAADKSKEAPLTV